MENQISIDPGVESLIIPVNFILDFTIISIFILYVFWNQTLLHIVSLFGKLGALFQVIVTSVKDSSVELLLNNLDLVER